MANTKSPGQGGGVRWPSGLELYKKVVAWPWTGDQTVPGRVRKLRFATLAVPFTPLCQCLSEDTLKAVGPFSLVSGEVKDLASPYACTVCVGL